MTRENPARIAALIEALPPAFSARTKAADALTETSSFGDECCIVGTHRKARGALTRGDIERAVRFGLGASPLEELVVGEVSRVPLTGSIASALKELRRGVAPLVVVVDSRERPIGCLTRTALEGRLLGGQGTGAERAANLLRQLSGPTRELLRGIGTAAPQGAWLVGGVVRDLCLGRSIEDLDVVVANGLEQVIAAIEGDTRSLSRFETGTVEKHGLRIDLAQARRESYARPAALPVIESAGLSEDLFRRDFTVNALALGLTAESWDRLFDLYGGRDDLRRRRIRVLHGLSFMDDPTRAFRAVRFAARLSFSFERRTLRAMQRAISAGAIEGLTPVRVLRELRLTLSERSLGRVVTLLERHGLLASLHLDSDRAALALRRLPALLRRYEQLEGAPPVERWIVVLGLLLPAESAGILTRLGPSRGERDALAEIADHARPLAKRLAAARRPSAIWRACEDLRPSTWIAAVASSGTAQVRRRLELYVTQLRSLRLAIDGDDLRRAGVAPGPAIAKGLDAARAALIDGRAADARSQLRIALRAAAAS